LFPICPEAGAPNENLFLNCAEHEQDQTDGSELSEDAKDHSEPSGKLSRAQKNRKTFSGLNVFAPRLGIFDVVPATGDKHNPNHETQKEKRDVGELG